MSRSFFFGKFIPFVFLVISLFFLRFELLEISEIQLKESFKFDTEFGFLYDFGVCFIPLIFTSFIFAFLRVPKKFTWLVVSFCVWASTFVNVIYFKFFGGPISLWVLKMHFQDILLVKGNVNFLASSPYMFLSVVCYLFCLFFTFRFREVKSSFNFLLVSKSLFVSFLSFLALMTFLMHRSPVVRSTMGVGPKISEKNAFNQQVIVSWYEEMFLSKAEAGAHSYLSFSEARARDVLLEYQGVKKNDTKTIYNKDYPLVRSLDLNLSKAKKLRSELGLPLSGPVNVIYFFVESLRMFELLQPELQKEIFPNITKVLDEKSIFFTQAYTSSVVAGQTVRGMFSTNCSLLPNINQVATYIGKPSLNAFCMAEHLKNNDYKTMWINPHHKEFHNKYIFESFHGVDHFYDMRHFKKMGAKKLKFDYGYEDEDFYRIAFKTLLKESKGGSQPFFTTLLNTGTHSPGIMVPGFDLSESLMNKTVEDPNYRGYLSQLKAFDISAGKFFNDLFKSKLADNTIVVFMSDHSIRYSSFYDTNELQKNESVFRIPIALITKNMKNPRKVNKQVHQVDVTPTVAKILGYPVKATQWMGRGLFAKESTPFVYSQGSRLHFRKGNEVCYTKIGDKVPSCWSLSDGQDPLVDKDISKVRPNIKNIDFFRDLIDSQHYYMNLNRFISNEMVQSNKVIN